VITTSRDIDREGHSIQKGSKGTIVHVYKGSDCYAAEFTAVPENAIINIYDCDIVT
jgi:hypothetical protein